MSVCDHIEARRRGIATWIEPSNIRVTKHAGCVRWGPRPGLPSAGAPDGARHDPYATVCGFGADLSSYPRALAYVQLAEVATLAEHMQLTPGTTFAFEPNCVFDGKLASIGGTVTIGEGGPIEVNPLTARLLRARLAQNGLAAVMTPHGVMTVNGPLAYH